MSTSEGSDDEEYQTYPGLSHSSLERRYPIHDACEFDDIEALKVRDSTSHAHRS